MYVFYLSHLHSTPPQIHDRIKSALQYSLVQGLSVFHSPSHTNSLGNIQVTWQLYSACQPMETAHCFCICLITHTYNTIQVEKYGGWACWACSDSPHIFFHMHQSYRHDSTHPGLFTSWGALPLFRLPSCKERIAVFYFFSKTLCWNFSHGEIRTRDLPLA